jgi:hypothetical protein
MHYQLACGSYFKRRCEFVDATVTQVDMGEVWKVMKRVRQSAWQRVSVERYSPQIDREIARQCVEMTRRAVCNHAHFRFVHGHPGKLATTERGALAKQKRNVITTLIVLTRHTCGADPLFRRTAVCGCAVRCCGKSQEAQQQHTHAPHDTL